MSCHNRQTIECRQKNREYFRDYYREYNKRPYVKERIRQYDLAHKKEHGERGARRRRELREMAFDHYGRGCACCGEKRYEFLAIDHIGGGGRKHFKEIGGYGYFYYWLKDNNYPTGFRILCHNCNQALGAYGYCPHQREKIIKPIHDRLPISEILS